jgi:cystathionine beta-synthase
MAHYNETGLEIFEQCDGKLDYCILGVGTGGTVTGVGRRLKELDPNIKIIGVDPPGSVLSRPHQFNIDNPAAPGG